MRKQLREVTSGLAFRIAVLLALALLPVGAIAVYQTLQVVARANAQAEDALLAVASDAAAREAGLIRTAIGAGQAIGAMSLALRDDAEACHELLGDFVRISGSYSFAAYVSPDGMLCSSGGHLRDVSGARIHQLMLEANGPQVELVSGDMLAGVPSVVVLVPMRADSGEFDGYVSVALPQTRLFSRLDEVSSERPVDVVTFNDAGNVLSSEAGLDQVDQRLPAGFELADFIGEPAVAFTDWTRGGQSRVFAVVPLITNTVYSISSWDDDALAYAPSLRNLIMPVLFPALMWLASLAVAFMAVRRMVIRPTRNLRARMLLFMRSRQVSPPKFDRLVSSEMRDIDQTWSRMAESVIRDEAELEDMLHDKTVLLKEVHHRVKNNLQLIASILNMRIRRTNSRDARGVLQDVQHRVMSMATVHRHLYETSDEGRVRMDELMPTIVDHVTGAVLDPALDIELTQDYRPLVLYPDQAVPLTLAATETITNALKYIGRPDDGAPWISIRLFREDETTAVLEVGNSLGTDLGGKEPAAGSGMGEQLIRAFAAQLEGTVSHETGDASYVVVLRFPVQPFDQGAV